MIRILIADDHAVVRHGLRQIVARDPQMEIVGEAKDGFELIDLVRTQPADVVVLDMKMPNKNGLDTLKELRREYPRLPVMVLSMHAEDQFAIRALRAGAAGYMSKESAPDELVKAIRKAYQGGKYISEELAEMLAQDIVDGRGQEPHRALSDREFQVLCSIALGRTNGQISEDLNLSVKTVSTYRTRILEKMGMTSNAELTRYAIQRDLV